MEDPSNNSALPLNQANSLPLADQHGYQSTTPNTLNQSHTHQPEAAPPLPYQQSQTTVPYSQNPTLSSYGDAAYPTPEQPPINAPPYSAPPYDTLYPASLPYPVQQAGDPAYIPPKVDTSDPPPPYPGPPNAVHYEAHLLPINPSAGTVMHNVTTTTTTVHSHQPSGAAGNQAPGNVTIIRTVQDDGQEIESYLVLSFFSVFCCFCFGIFALIKASSVGSLVSAGRYAEARRASNQAKTWATLAIIFGLLNAATNIIRVMISDL